MSAPQPPEDPSAEPETIHIETTEEIKVKAPISRFLLQYLEDDAHRLAASLANMVGGLSSKLHAMSAVSKEAMEIHSMAAHSVGETVDESIKQMSSLIVKCGEISDSMVPIEQLLVQIKSVKRTLDILEEELDRR